MPERDDDEQIERDLGRELLGYLLHELREIKRGLDQLKQGERRIMDTQADVQVLIDHENSVVSQLGVDLAATNEAVATVSSEVAALIAQAPPGLDLSGLKAAMDAADAQVANFGTVAQNVLAIVPATPAPAPEPIPEPAPTGDVTNADGSVTHADGTTTHPDGSVTAADGSIITPAPGQ